MTNRLLTLPPEVGNKYFMEYLGKPGVRIECEIIRAQEWEKGEKNPSSTGFIYKGVCADGSEWSFWPDGEAKRTKQPPVCKLVEDLHTQLSEELPVSEEFAQLRDQHEERMARLRALGA